jgi:hypothetical protein
VVGAPRPLPPHPERHSPVRPAGSAPFIFPADGWKTCQPTSFSRKGIICLLKVNICYCVVDESIWLQQQRLWGLFPGQVRRRQSMKKLACLNFCTAVLILAVAPVVLFSGSAQAYVYDHFDSPGINPSLWVDRGPNTGLFSQPGDSYLYFTDASGGQDDRLRSYNPVSGTCSVLMQYSNFQAINNQPAGQGQASGISLVLGDGSNGIYLTEGKDSIGLFFSARLNSNGNTIYLKSIRIGNIYSGGLEIRYNGVLGAGGKVDCLYNIGARLIILESFAPNFSKAPWFSIEGYNVYGESLSFQVDQVQVIIPGPAPMNLLLLEPDS